MVPYPYVYPSARAAQPYYYYNTCSPFQSVPYPTLILHSDREQFLKQAGGHGFGFNVDGNLMGKYGAGLHSGWNFGGGQGVGFYGDGNIGGPYGLGMNAGANIGNGNGFVFNTGGQFGGNNGIGLQTGGQFNTQGIGINAGGSIAGHGAGINAGFNWRY